MPPDNPRVGTPEEWLRRARSNLLRAEQTRKTVFRDPLASLFDDPAHSLSERRELIIGHSALDRLLIVAFTERAPGRVRIISARKTTRREREDNEQKPQP